MFAEHRQLNWKYMPFVGWRRNTFQGLYINIDSEGRRFTWMPERIENKELLKIFIFGGSTVWGTGSRDDYTIPSWLSKQFNERGIAASVINYGESAYTFNEEIILLTLLLKKGERPDCVIFYDGVNDSIFAYNSGQTGLSEIHDQIRIRVDAQSYNLPFHKKMVVVLTNLLKKNSMTYKGIHKCTQLIEQILNRDTNSNTVNKKSIQLRLNDLSDKVKDTYLQNHVLLQVLSDGYNFDFLCFWQPCLLTEETVMEEEKYVDDRYNDKNLTYFFREMNETMKEVKKDQFCNISDTFSNRKSTFYFDFCHVTEEANQVIAKKIFEIWYSKYHIPEETIINQ